METKSNPIWKIVSWLVAAFGAWTAYRLILAIMGPEVSAANPIARGASWGEIFALILQGVVALGVFLYAREKANPVKPKSETNNPD